MAINGNFSNKTTKSQFPNHFNLYSFDFYILTFIHVLCKKIQVSQDRLLLGIVAMMYLLKYTNVLLTIKKHLCNQAPELAC